MQTNTQSNTPNVKPIEETGVTYKPMVFQASVRRANGTGTIGITPDAKEHQAVDAELQKMVERGATKTMLVEFLLDRNWTTSAISNKIVYESDSRTGTRKAGSPMLPQHVNQIKQKWLSKKIEAEAKAKAAPTADKK